MVGHEVAREVSLARHEPRVGVARRHGDVDRLAVEEHVAEAARALFGGVVAGEALKEAVEDGGVHLALEIKVVEA